MNGTLEHISLNISDPKKSFPFYKDLFTFLGYEVFHESEDSLALRKDGTPDFWLSPTEEKYSSNGFHRKNTGLNHLAFTVDSKEDVDKFYSQFLKPKGMRALYDSPKLFPEYTPDYYAVYFEDPDRMKIEINYFSKNG